MVDKSAKTLDKDKCIIHLARLRLSAQTVAVEGMCLERGPATKEEKSLKDVLIICTKTHHAF